MNDNYYAVIMAGGGGTRLWPLSRMSRPKQLLSFGKDKSLFTLAVERLEGQFKPENIYIVTIAEQVPALLEQAPFLSRDQFINEPQPKGTASVIGLAAINLLQKNSNAVMAVLTADHIIENLPVFHTLLATAYPLAEQNHLITLGIEPAYPATGYGYIKAGKNFGITTALIVKKFVEKPGQKLASQYIRDGNYFWNSGMFIWRADRILEEFRIQMPELYKKLDQISAIFGKSGFKERFFEIWDSIVPQTIDYGIMENAKDVLLLKGENLEWNDVGSWDSLYDFLPVDISGNVIKNKHSMVINSKDILVFSENDKKMVAVVGLQDLVIIDTDNALLICKKGETQRVKEIVEELKNKKLNNYL
jgi:mannose-1-phosphate guanylyltransferase